MRCACACVCLCVCVCLSLSVRTCAYVRTCACWLGVRGGGWGWEGGRGVEGVGAGWPHLVDDIVDQFGDDHVTAMHREIRYSIGGRKWPGVSTPSTHASVSARTDRRAFNAFTLEQNRLNALSLREV